MIIKQIAAIKNARLLILGMCLQTLYLIFSIVYFQERILYADSSKYLVEILGEKDFYITNRLIVPFSCLLPTLGAIMNCSVKFIMMLYSLNIALMYIIPFFIILLALKNKELAVSILLYQFSFPYFTHYLAISELQFGIIFLILYWALLSNYIKNGKPTLKQIIIYPLLFIIMNSHPLIIIAFITSSFLFYDNISYWSKEQTLLWPLALFFYFLSRLIFTTNYESHLLMNVFNNLLFSEADIYLLRVMLSELIRTYYPFIFPTIFSLYLLFKSYPIKIVLLILAIFSAYFYLIYLGFYDRFIISTFYEIYLSLIVFLLIIILVLSFNVFKKNLRHIVITTIFLSSFIQFGRSLNHSKFYHERIEIYENLFSQMKENDFTKVVLPFYKAPMDKIIDTYHVSYETYLLSLIDLDTSNNGYTITYLLKDSIYISNYNKYSNSFFRQNNDSIISFPFTQYPNLYFSDEPYGTFDAKY